MKNRVLKIAIIVLSFFGVFGFFFGITRFMAGDVPSGLKICGLAVVGVGCLIGAYFSLRDK